MQLLHLHPLSLILSLASSATAISIRFGGQCYNPTTVGCEDLNPGICCFVSPNRLSATLVAVPNEWNVRYDGYGDTNCQNSKFTVSRIPGTTPCQARDGGFGSAAYFFNSRKLVRKEEGQECQRVDTFYAEDGSKYGISHLDDAGIQYLVRLPITHLFYCPIY
jgi:hypothetical protein